VLSDERLRMDMGVEHSVTSMREAVTSCLDAARKVADAANTLPPAPAVTSLSSA
jgi:hypothetical protein